jgi:hypothetical protein
MQGLYTQLFFSKIIRCGGMVDAPDLGSGEFFRMGSSPITGI